MSELLDSLNDSQREAVLHKDGPLLIVAGAGTGKTTVLTQRYVHLLTEAKVGTEAILALTFTEKAAGEMEDRVIKALPTGAYDFWISTFHGFCQRLLEAHGLEIGLPNKFRLLTETDAWILLKRNLEQLPLKHYRPLGNPVKFLNGLLRHISRAKDEGITPDTYQAFVGSLNETVPLDERERLKELADLYAMYRQLLLDHGCMDFGDLILETLRLLRERPAILERYRQQFRFVMVDEFQDTNWAQYELVKLLAGERRNLTVVGDDDQAIYKFRGASLANILQFRDDYPEAKTVTLTQNYRSHQEILDVSYGFITHNNPNRLEVKLAETGLSKKLSASKGEGAAIEARWFTSLEEETEQVAKRIKRLKETQPELQWNDVAILVRSNDGAEPFIRALEQHSIPFQFMALRGLYVKPIVLDVVALLAVIQSPHESVPWWRVFSLPCFDLSATDRAVLFDLTHATGWPVWEVMRELIGQGSGLVKRGKEAVRADEMSSEGLALIRRVVELVIALSESAQRERPLKVLQWVMEKTGLLETVMKQRNEREKLAELGQLNAFADRVRRYEQTAIGPSLRGFLDEFQLELESGDEGALQPLDDGPDQVKVMTVHAAKGLEFRHVFVVSMVDQRFPTRGRTDAIPLPDGLVQERLPEGDVHMEEERRLFYVAVTRAKETLTFTGGSDYGGTRPKKPSAFLVECAIDWKQHVSDDSLTVRLTSEPSVSVLDDVFKQRFQLKKRFSFTQLAAFKKCPLQYKFEHIYRIPKLGNHHKIFGQSLHAAFQQIIELHMVRVGESQGQSSLFDVVPTATVKGFRVTEDEALSIFEACWQDEWYETRLLHDEHWAKGRVAIKYFWSACQANVPKPWAVEKPFTLVLGEHSLIGKIDRVDELPDGSVEVWDYKTGQAKETLEAGDKEQLYLYQVALEEQGKRVSRMKYVYVLDGAEAFVDPLEGEKREAFIEKLEERMNAIVASDFQAEPEVHVCKHCDFQSICEFKKLK